MTIFITVICTIVSVAAILILIRFLLKRDERLKSLSQEFQNTKEDIKNEMDDLKNNVSDKLSEVNNIPDFRTNNVLGQQSNSNILCPECITANKKQIEEYYQHMDDLPEENIQSEDDDFESLGEGSQTVDIKTLIQPFSSAEEYAHHILQSHPNSPRVEWADEYLRLLGEVVPNNNTELETEDSPQN